MKSVDAADIIFQNITEDHSSIKTLDFDELELLSAHLREQIIEACSEYGGHLSSNLGAVELTVAIHHFFDLPKDKLIFDVGHQAYAHKLLSGRKLDHMGEEGFTSPLTKIAESPFDPYDAGHSSTAIAAAEAFAIARDEKKEDFDVVAFVGDASIVNGLAIEGLNDLGQRGNKVIIVLNDNDMSISPPSGGISKFFRGISTGVVYSKGKHGFYRATAKTAVGRFFFRVSRRIKNAIKRQLVPPTMFDNMGFNYIGPIDGHDIKAIEKAFRRAKRSDRPVVIHARTIKGKGYPYAEADKTGYWHHCSPFHIGTGQPKNNHPGFITWSHYFADLTLKEMESHPEARLIVPATLKGSGLEKAFGFYPQRCFDFGIAEEHALTFSGALALNGAHPIVCIYSTFLQRAYDELFHDCARLGVDMTLLLDRACLCGGLGETHQGIFDEAYLSSIPGVTLAMPSDKAIAQALFDQSFQHHGVFAIRYPRELVDERTEPPAVELPYLRFRYEGNSKSKKLAIVAVGPREKEILALLKKHYLDLEVIDPVYLSPIQKDNILPLLAYENLLIYDAYGTEQGFAKNLRAELLEAGYRGKVYTRAIPNQFIGSNTYQKQLEQFGLLPSQIVALAKEIIGK